MRGMRAVMRTYIVNDHFAATPVSMARPIRLLKLSTPTSPLESLIVDDATLAAAMRLRGQSADRFNSMSGSQYQDRQRRSQLPSSSTYRYLSSCCRLRGQLLQRIILGACLFTTLLTWSGLLKHGHRKINKFISYSMGDGGDFDGCSKYNRSVEYGHTNPCWRLGMPPDCKQDCPGQLVCAPKTIFAGVDGCYDSEMLTPLGFQYGILLLEDRINFNDECPIEYLVKHYNEVVMAIRGTEGNNEPVFFTNDEHLLSSLVSSYHTPGSKFHTELTKLSYWMRPKSSNLVVFMCDPVVRLLKHINDSLILVEPTKQAVHKYLVSRLEKAKRCLDKYDIVQCQQTDQGGDQLYTYLLQGIYLPYMVELQKFMPRGVVHLEYYDRRNASSYSPMIKELARSLSVNINYEKLKAVEARRHQVARDVSKLTNNLHPATLLSIQQFYEPYMDDVKRLISLYT